MKLKRCLEKVRKLNEDEKTTSAMAEGASLPKKCWRSELKSKRISGMKIPFDTMVKEEPGEGIVESDSQENCGSYLNSWSSGDDDDSGYGGQGSESSGVPAITPVKTIDMEVEGDEARTDFKMWAKTHPNLHRLHTGLPPSAQPHGPSTMTRPKQST